MGTASSERRYHQVRVKKLVVDQSICPMKIESGWENKEPG